jgi:hypothetical protein
VLKVGQLASEHKMEQLLWRTIRHDLSSPCVAVARFPTRTNQRRRYDETAPILMIIARRWSDSNIRLPLQRAPLRRLESKDHQ